METRQQQRKPLQNTLNPPLTHSSPAPCLSGTRRLGKLLTKQFNAMKVIGLIKEHDFYYMMSDDPRKYEQGFRQEQEIARELNEGNIEQVLAAIPEHQRKYVEDLYVRISN